MTKKKVLIAFVVVVIIGVLSSVLLASLNTIRSKSSSGGVASPLTVPQGLGGLLGFSGITQSESAPSGNNTPLEEIRSIIKTASLALLVQNAEEAVSQITELTEASGGFVESSQVREVSRGVKNGSIQIRIPATAFNSAITAIKNIAIEVTEESTRSQDVTDQLVDLDTRIKNLEKAEVQFQKLMERAGEINDILNVQRQLNTTRDQIERLKAQQEQLTKRVAMSTISISLISEPDVTVFGIRWRPLFVAKQAVRDSLSDLAGFSDSLIKFAILLPVLVIKWGTYLILAFIIFLIGRKVFWWCKRKFFNVRE